LTATIIFWIVAAALVAVALAFLLPPLLRSKQAAALAGRRSINIAVYRDQMKEMEADLRNGLLSAEQFDTAKLELEARLAQDAIDSADDAQPVRRGGRVLGFSLAGLLPIAAFGIYLTLGNPDAINAEARGTDANVAQGGHDLREMLKKIEAKAQAEPNNAEAWAMLAKTYGAMDRWPDALKAYERAVTLSPKVPAVMTGYAEALAIANNRALAGKPMELVLKALEIDPNDSKGLELAAIANFQDKNYAQAAYYFKHLLKQLPPESPYAQDITNAMQEANRLAHGGAEQLDNLGEAGKAKPAAAGAGASIRGKVDIAPAIKAKVNPQDVIFLFARPSASGAPVAALRATAGKFPIDFELTDAMAMTPDNRLSNFKEVTLTVRVSKSGDVKGAPGDLEGSLANVKVGAKDVSLVIDKVRN
jgi:cytochrome c-type biogenesis protein CcmH